MAVIKLSTNITDIRGKSNGSVFSKNKGGNYFRNNPGPVQKNTDRFQKRKLIFSGVSGKWRDLTPEQQQSWNDAAVNFPQKNKVGEQMILSGANLYQKMNTSLVTIGSPQIVNPPMNNTLPTFPDAVTSYPDLVQFVSTKSYNILQSNLDQPTAGIEIPEQPTPIDVSEGITVAFNLKIHTASLANLPANLDYDILNLSVGSARELAISIRKDSSGGMSYKLLLMDDGAHIVDFTNSFGKFQLDVWDSIAVSMSTGLTGGVGIVFGRASGPFSLPYVATVPVPAELNSVMVHTAASNVVIISSLANLQIDAKSYEEDELRAFAFNYITPMNRIMLDFRSVINGKFPYAAGVAYTNLAQFLNGTSSGSTIKNDAPLFAPLFTIDGGPFENPDIMINVFSSGPISQGITGKLSRKRLIGSFFASAKPFETLSLAYEKVFTYTPPGSQVLFYIEVVDIDSGYKEAQMKETKKNVIRFKAGSDVSDAVNV